MHIISFFTSIKIKEKTLFTARFSILPFHSYSVPAPNLWALPTQPYSRHEKAAPCAALRRACAHLRRMRRLSQAEQLPLIRRLSIRRTHRQFFSYRKAKTGTSPFIYGHVVIFMPEKMGKLQNFRVCHYRRENDIITTFFDGETVSLNESNDNFMATSSIKSIYENCRT